MRIFQSTLPARGATVRAAEFGGRAEPFQSTLPARGATASALRVEELPLQHFNPRSPHGERRPAEPPAAARAANFNPRSPHGERPDAAFHAQRIAHLFQSTLPARGATRPAEPAERASRFQSTLPARGATPAEAPAASRASNFNPRSPHGERRALRWIPCPATAYFNPRSPHGERQAPERAVRGHGSDFNPRSPHGERPVPSLISPP